jgi:hypothetical protein
MPPHRRVCPRTEPGTAQAGPGRPRPGMGSGHSLHPVPCLRRSGISLDHLRRPGPCVPGDSSS